MYFIILTTALTLHAHGITELETSRQVAQALRLLEGRFALAGSDAYALVETFGWREGMDEHLRCGRDDRGDGRRGSCNVRPLAMFAVVF
jgi:hypothetical protein